MHKQTIQLTAQFAALAICIHLFESSLPNIMGIKPGLANVITLIVLLRYGLNMAIQVQLLRVFIGSLLSGSLFTPTFFLSACGSFFALLSLGLVLSLLKIISTKSIAHNLIKRSHLPSAISFSIIASLSHMSGQFILAYYWLIPHLGLFQLLPILLAIALVFGWVNGIMAQLVLNQLNQTSETPMHAE